MIQFAFGITLLSLLLGVLVGASSSYVAGVAITAGFRVVAPSLRYIQSNAIGHPRVVEAARIALCSTQSERVSGEYVSAIA